MNLHIVAFFFLDESMSASDAPEWRKLPRISSRGAAETTGRRAFRCTTKDVVPA